MCGTCDGRYARSRQGLCKVGQVVLGMLIWIVIAASPYWKPIFLLEGTTWPFHVVMLFVFLPWMATIIMYFIFLSGYHYNFGHVNWPKTELIFNIVCLVLYLVAGVIESTNLWRWDYSYGSPMNYNGGIRQNGYYSGGRMGGNNYGGYGRGMGLTQKMNFQSYCMRYPRDCQDYLSMLAGYNTYFGNHIFATVFIWITFVIYLVSTWFAWKMFREFQDKYWKPGQITENGEQLPAHAWIKPDEGPSIWKSTVGKLRAGLSGVERKMQSIVKRGEDDKSTDGSDSVGTHPVGQYRHDQIVSINNQQNSDIIQYPAAVQNYSAPSSQHERRSNKSDNSKRSRRKRPNESDRTRRQDEYDGVTPHYTKPKNPTYIPPGLPTVKSNTLVEEPHVSMLV